jgi:hypothetical protein
MMKKTILFFLLFAAVSAYAQDAEEPAGPWKTSGLISLTFNQSSFSNWTAGGENSVAFTAVGKYFADYTKNNFSVNNALTLKYGILKNESFDNPRKNEDQIELISRFNHKFSNHWSASGQINFTSQFANGYNYPDDSTVVSKFMAPGYLTIAPGLVYKPVDYFSILITPITMRGIFVADQQLADAGAYGVDAAVYDTTGGQRVKVEDGKQMKIKLGAFAEFYIKKDLKTDLSLESRLNFFYNYLQDNNIPDGKMPLDVNWQTFINYKLNKFFSTNLYVQLAYMPGDVFIDRKVLVDNDPPAPNDKVQLFQTFGFGLAFNF